MTEAAAEDLGNVLQHEHEALADLFRRVTSPEEDRGAVLGELIRQLAAHVSVEDSLLSPVVRKRLTDGHDLSRQLKADHRQMQGLLVRIERRKPNSPDQPQMVTELADVFRRHSEQWATRIQPAIDAEVPRQEQADLRDKVVSAQGMIVSHPHPHLLPLGPISRFTTRLASRWDLLRDTLSGRRKALGEQRRPGQRPRAGRSRPAS